MKKKEKVLVFNAKHMDGFKNLPGISTLYKDTFHLKYECGKDAYYEDREIAEKNEEIKQIIPYVVIRKGKKVFTYLRSKKSGENRLHDKWSCGIGGHINPIDNDSQNGINMAISNAINRELLEELEWGDTFDVTINYLNELGLIYDDKDPVGRVHLGYIFTVDIPEDKIDSKYPRPHEDTIADHKWLTVEEALLLNLEGWSKIALEAIVKIDKEA